MRQSPETAQGEPGAEREVRGRATLVGDFASVTSGRVAALALGVVTIVLTTRLLSPADYALIAYVNVAGMFMFYCAAGWSSASVSRYGREELERTGSLRRSSSARLLLTAPLIPVAGAVLVGVGVAGWLPQEYTWPFVWLTLALGVLLITSDHLVTLLQAAGRMRVSALGLVGRQALLVLGLSVVALAGAGGSPMLILSLTLGAAAVLTAWLAVPLWGLALWPPRLDREQLRRMLVFSLPLIAFTASQYGIRSVDIFVLRAYGSATDVGIYALAYQGYSTLLQVATTVTGLLVPLFVSMQEAGRGVFVVRYFRRVVPQMTFVAAGALALLAPLVVLAVPLTFGSDYADAARPMAVLTLALVFYGVASLVAPILLLHERSRAMALVSVAALAVNVIGDIVLVGVLGAGVLGPAIATVVAIGVIAAGYLRAARRDVPGVPAMSPLLVLPLAAAIVPVLALGPALGATVGVVVGVVAVVLVLRFVPLFAAGDAELIDRLDIPGALRRRLVAVVTRLER